MSQDTPMSGLVSLNSSTRAASMRSLRPDVKLSHKSLSNEHVMVAIAAHTKRDNSSERLEETLQELSLLPPVSYDIQARLFELGVPASSTFLPSDVFLHMVNELWEMELAQAKEETGVRNAYDAMHSMDLDPNASSTDTARDITSRGGEKPSAANALLSFVSTAEIDEHHGDSNQSHVYNLVRPKTKEVEMDADELARDPVTTIVMANTSKNYKTFSRIFTGGKDDPELVAAFKRLGAVDSDIGFLLDTTVLEAKCHSAGLSDGDVVAVLNIFDEDSNGEVDFEEFCRVMVSDHQQLGVSKQSNLVRALKKLLFTHTTGLNNRPSNQRREQAKATMRRVSNIVARRGGSASAGRKRRMASMSLMDVLDLRIDEDEAMTAEDANKALLKLQKVVEECEEEMDDLDAWNDEAAMLVRRADAGQYHPFFNSYTGQKDLFLWNGDPPLGQHQGGGGAGSPSGQGGGNDGTRRRRFRVKDVKRREAHPRMKAVKYAFSKAQHERTQRERELANEGSSKAKFAQELKEAHDRRVIHKCTEESRSVNGFNLPAIAGALPRESASTKANNPMAPHPPPSGSGSNTQRTRRQSTVKIDDDESAPIDTAPPSKDADTQSDAGASVSGSSVGRSSSRRSSHAYTKRGDEKGYLVPTRRGSYHYLEEQRKNAPKGIEHALYDKVLAPHKPVARDRSRSIAMDVTPRKKKAHARREVMPPPAPEHLALPYAVGAVTNEMEAKDRDIPKSARVAPLPTYSDKYFGEASGIYNSQVLSARMVSGSML